MDGVSPPVTLPLIDHLALRVRAYAAFVIDPDGNNVEAVFHGDRQPSAA